MRGCFMQCSHRLRPRVSILELSTRINYRLVLHRVPNPAGNSVHGSPGVKPANRTEPTAMTQGLGPNSMPIKPVSNNRK